MSDHSQFVEKDALANACKCGDCYHPLIGPDTDGEHCDWCRDCGCPSADHARMTYVCMVPGCGLTAVELHANEAPLLSPEYAERWVCRWHVRNPFGEASVTPPGKGAS